MTQSDKFPVYELALSYRARWQAHSASNAGTNGSNRLLPRRQMLADGTETDARTGNIDKHYHASLLRERFLSEGIPLCPACVEGDGRRAMALVGTPGYENLSIDRIIQECGICDLHGFLVTAKNSSDDKSRARQRISKHSTLEFSFALALPDQQAETSQLFTRIGDSKEEGQMLMKMPTRSGIYAMNIRYKSAGIGVDTDKWRVVLADEGQRRQRHRAALAALRDQVLSPGGALTSTMLPHLSGIEGIIAIQTTAGRAPIYSALDDTFIEQLFALRGEECLMAVFESAAEFAARMNHLIEESYPCVPARHTYRGREDEA